MNLQRNALLLALLTAVMAVIGDWSGDPTLASLWKAPAGLLLLGLAYESRVIARAALSLQIRAPQHWRLGRRRGVQFAFEHRLGRKLALQFAPAAPELFDLENDVRALSVPPQTAAQVEVHASPRRLGAYTWPAVRVRIGGPLGLAWWSKTLRADCAVRVAPDLLQGGPENRGVGAVGARSGTNLGAGAELLQLRPYQPGDPPRAIDWKASARAQRLISRDFSEDQHLEIVIAVDAGRASGLRAGELDRFGHYVNVAARLAQHAVTQDDRVGLVLFADRPLAALAPARGAAAVTRIRALLAAATVERSESNPLHAAMRVRGLARHRSLVVLLTDLDDATVAGQLMSAVRLLLPKHLPFIAGLSSAAAETLARASAHHWLDPYRALAAQEYVAGLDRKVQALRSLGAPALVAKPDQLERAVFDAYENFRRRRRV